MKLPAGRTGQAVCRSYGFTGAPPVSTHLCKERSFLVCKIEMSLIQLLMRCRVPKFWHPSLCNVFMVRWLHFARLELHVEAMSFTVSVTPSGVSVLFKMRLISRMFCGLLAAKELYGHGCVLMKICLHLWRWLEFYFCSRPERLFYVLDYSVMDNWTILYIVQIYV